MKKFLYTLSIIFLVGVFCFAAWQLYTTIAEYEAGTSAYEGLNQFVSVETAPKTEVQQPQESEEMTGETTAESTEATEVTDETE